MATGSENISKIIAELNNTYQSNWVTAITSASTINIDLDKYNICVVTALAANATIAEPTGTPRYFQDLLYYIYDNGTQRTLTWNEAFRASDDVVTLPANTTVGKWTVASCKYNYVDSKYDVLAITTVG